MQNDTHRLISINFFLTINFQKQIHNSRFFRKVKNSSHQNNIILDNIVNLNFQINSSKFTNSKRVEQCLFLCFVPRDSCRVMTAHYQFWYCFFNDKQHGVSLANADLGALVPSGRSRVTDKFANYFLWKRKQFRSISQIKFIQSV